MKRARETSDPSHNLKETLDNTLKANLKLQEAIEGELRRIGDEKSRNRKQAAELLVPPPFQREDPPYQAIVSAAYRRPRKVFFSDPKDKDYPYPQEWMREQKELYNKYKDWIPAEKQPPLEVQVKLKRNAVWTVEEDELLFKLCIHIFGSRRPVDPAVLSPYFPDKTIIHVRDRVKFIVVMVMGRGSSPWTVREEREAVLLMRMYKNDFGKVAMHLGRLHKAVHDKWHRTLNPVYASGAFDKEEDALLLKYVREGLGWTEVSQEMGTFGPRRHPMRLMNRWREIATAEDVQDFQASRKSNDDDDIAES